MRNEIKIFESPEFGRIRTVSDERGEPWFCLADVCKVLGLKQNGVKIFSSGSMEMDLTQTSYSTIPSIDIELGDGKSAHDDATLGKLADGLVVGVNSFFGR